MFKQLVSKFRASSPKPKMLGADIPGVHRILPKDPRCLLNLARTQLRARNLHDAKAAVESALEYGAEKWEANWILADIAILNDQHHDAMRILDSIDPPEAHAPRVNLTRASLLVAKGACAESAELCRQILAKQPHMADAWSTLSQALGREFKFAEAEQALLQALRYDPRSHGALKNLSFTRALQGDYEGECALYERICRYFPDDHDAHFLWGACNLRLGKWDKGWDLIEERKRSNEFNVNPEYLRNLPTWDGSISSTETLIIYCEQGIGDNLQMARYFPLVSERVGRLVVACADELHELFALVPGVHAVTRRLPAPSELAELDTGIASISLPRLFGARVGEIYSPGRYLGAPPETMRDWAEYTRQFSGLKVGLVWSGSKLHSQNVWRSMEFSELKPLFNVSGVTFFPLQIQDIPDRADQPRNFVDCSDRLVTFADSAALIENLDLLISVDSSPVHLAGAMNRPVWTMLHVPVDWRWGVSGSASAWYPSMRLFRKNNVQNWAPVIAEVARALRDWASTNRRTTH